MGSIVGSRAHVFLSRERMQALEGRDRSGLMPDTPDAPIAPVATDGHNATAVSTTAAHTHVGSLSSAISNAVVGLLRDYTGRGPTHARTTIGPDTIVVTLRNSLTKAERTLASHGQELE